MEPLVQVGDARQPHRHERRHENGDDDGEDGAAEPDHQPAGEHQHPELVALQAQRAQHAVVARLGERLAHEGLTDDEQEGDERKERNKAHRGGLDADGPLDLRRLQRPALHEAGGLPVGEALDALGERVELARVTQADEEQRARHDVRSVAVGEGAGEVEGGARSGPTGGNSDGDASMPTMRNVTSGPSASSSIALLDEPGAPARRAPKLLSSVAAAVGKLDGRTKRRRIVLPGWRPSRSASTKLAVASSMARGSAARPSLMSIRSITVPKRSSAGSTGNRSTGPTRRPSPVRPVNTRLTPARAVSRTWGSRSTSSTSAAPPRPKALRPATMASAARIVRLKSR